MDQSPQTHLNQQTSLHPWVWLILLVAVAAVYAGAMQGGFYLDDYVAIENNRVVCDLGLSWKLALISDRGPVNLSLAINYAVGQLDPFGYRLVNVVVHWLNGVLLYLLLVKALTCPSAS